MPDIVRKITNQIWYSETWIQIVCLVTIWQMSGETLVPNFLFWETVFFFAEHMRKL